MREIDFSEWERRETYEYFSRMSHPFYMVTFRQDVTGLYRYTKAQNDHYPSRVFRPHKGL